MKQWLMAGTPLCVVYNTVHVLSSYSNQMDVVVSSEASGQVQINL